MMSMSGNSKTTCRTCFDTTDDTFYSLTGKLVKDEERKTIAGFLWDIAKLDNDAGITRKLPQQICGNCLRKLKVSFSFVAQIQKVNKDMLKALRSKNNTSLEDTDEHESTDTEDNDAQDNTQDNTQDPIAVSRSSHQKKGKRGECAKECSKNSTLCGNDCHIEMKSMLHKLMSLQYQINARIKFDDTQVKEKKLTKQELKKMKLQQCYDKNGKVVDMNSIKSWFPIKTVEQANQVERKIENGSTDEVVAFLERIFSFREATVDDVLRYIFDDDLGEQFNLEGRSGKLSLISYNSILHCVRSVFPHLPTDVFLKMIRTYVLRCHNRNKQKKRNNKMRISKAGQEEDADEEAEIDETMNDEIDEGNNESMPMFSEFMSEDSIMIDQFDDDAKSETYSLTNAEYLEEVAVDELQPTQFNIKPDDESDSAPEEKSCVKNFLKKESVESKIKMAKISSLFPLSTHDQVSEIEKNLNDPEFAARVGEHIKGMKIHKGSLDKVFRSMFDDRLISDYNYEGRSGKRSISSLNLVQTHVHNAFSELTRKYTKVKKECVEKEMKMVNIASLFPITSQDEINMIEKKLLDKEFAEKTGEHIRSMRAHKGDLDKVLRCIFSDAMIYDYNFDGRRGKRSVAKLNLVSTHVFNAFPELTSLEFSKLIREYVFKSHNRYKNRQFQARKTDVSSY